jgi:hypothetical protein
MIVLRINMAIAVFVEINGNINDPIDHYRRFGSVSMFFHAIHCPFKDYVRFLESAALHVQECAFEWVVNDWDIELPDENEEGKFEWRQLKGKAEGRFEWRRNLNDGAGILTILWNGDFSGYRRKFHRCLKLKTREMVGMLYKAFRRFIESPEYEPIRYENLTFRKTFPMVISDASLDDFIKALLSCDYAQAESLVQAIREVVVKRACYGGEINRPLRYYIDRSFTPVEVDPVFGGWIGRDWNSWSLERRTKELDDLLDGWNGDYWLSDNPKGLRSELIENWLTTPEPKKWWRGRRLGCSEAETQQKTSSPGKANARRSEEIPRHSELDPESSLSI